jgi:hypothetical protein
MRDIFFLFIRLRVILSALKLLFSLPPQTGQVFVWLRRAFVKQHSKTVEILASPAQLRLHPNNAQLEIH